MVLGRMPLMGRPFREAGEYKAAKLGEREARILDELAPAVGELEVGAKLLKSGKEQFRWTQKYFQDNYNALREIARGTEATVNTQEVRLVARHFVDEIERKAIREGKKKKKLRIPKALKDLHKELKRVSNLPEDLTWDQLDGALTDLFDLNSAAREKGFSGLSDATVSVLNKAGEDAIRNISHPGLGARIKEMDSIWGLWQDVVKSPMAQRFGRVDRKLLKPGFSEPGTQYSDDLFDITIKAIEDSPQAVKDLRWIVGPELTQQTLRVHLKKAFDAARAAGLNASGDNVLHMKTLRSKLGIGDERREAALAEALKGSMVSIEKLKTFLQVVEDAAAIPIPDVSTFLARRITLGGGAGLIRALGGPVAAAGGGYAVTGNMSLAAVLAATGLSIKLAEAIANPSRLDMVTMALKRAKKENSVSEQTWSMLMTGLGGLPTAPPNTAQPAYAPDTEPSPPPP
jgi:hypothetical protein